jgi:MarR family transcriptional regulator, transcriptional regulator for hemolysin
MDMVNLFNQEPLSRPLGLIAKMYYGVLSKLLEHLDIEKHYGILVMIEQCSDGGCTQQHIADANRIDKASMVRIIDNLVERNLIERMTNPEDRREYRIVLTEKAKKMMPEVHKAIEELNKLCLNGLSKDEIDAFHKSLVVIGDNLKNLPAHEIQVCINKVKQ